MRGKQAPKRKIYPDAIYSSTLVSKLVNYLMLDGKKTVSEKLVYDAMEELAASTKAPALESLEKAIENIKPKVEIRSRRVGGANLQVPTPVSGERQVSLALRWLVDTTRSHRGSKPSSKALATELLAAFKGEGDAVRKREDTQRMAESNRAFAQFAA